jgi:pyruvate kinase
MLFDDLITIIPKIESPQAVNNIETIISEHMDNKI